ncbi:MAG: hypothetical protein NC097_06800 [Clostridium sp.]|nr:hypothetical protein [Prevotella sp.]MCM1429488.1 hypothetical protein [Clostridium sp.]
MKQKIKPFILPAAIVLGLLLHDVCGMISFIVPYVIFSILLLTFSSIELRKLRFSVMDVWLGAVQVGLAAALYFIGRLAEGETIAQGLMMCALCPVASSVTVIAVMLGANRTNTIAYTIVGNLLISFVAPVFFVFMDSRVVGETLTDSFFTIFGKVATIIGLPFFMMLFIQLWLKPVARKIKEYSGLSFYLWAVALLMTLGQTIDYIFIDGRGKWHEIIILGVGSFIVCALQFGTGRIIGRRYRDVVGGQQLLGQKNSAMGIWMANTYLNPLSSVSMAFYSIAQNLLNSWQIYRASKSQKTSPSPALPTGEGDRHGD